jgi:hypothetical protein
MSVRETNQTSRLTIIRRLDDASPGKVSVQSRAHRSLFCERSGNLDSKLYPTLVFPFVEQGGGAVGIDSQSASSRHAISANYLLLIIPGQAISLAATCDLPLPDVPIRVARFLHRDSFLVGRDLNRISGIIPVTDGKRLGDPEGSAGPVSRKTSERRRRGRFRRGFDFWFRFGRF